MDLKGKSDEAIEEAATFLIDTMDIHDLYLVLSWSDDTGTVAERGKLRAAMFRQGFLQKSLARFLARGDNNNLDKRWLLIYLLFGEFLEQRRMLFACPGLMEAVIDALQNDPECWSDAVALLWGILEDPVQAARYAHLAPFFLDDVDEAEGDSEQALGCVALLCRGAPLAVAAQEEVVTALGLAVHMFVSAMKAFQAAIGACHLFLATEAPEHLEIVQSFLEGSQERLLKLAAVLQQQERRSEDRWIALEWATDLLGAAEPLAVLLGLLAMTHLLQNPTNLPLFSDSAWETLVALQHHPDGHVRALWTLVLPFLKARPYQVPRLQLLIELQMRWRK